MNAAIEPDDDSPESDSEPVIPNETPVSKRVERWWPSLRDVRAELKHVTWPSRQEVFAMSIAVVVMSAIVGTYMWLLDIVLGRLEVWFLIRFGR